MAALELKLEAEYGGGGASGLIPSPSTNCILFYHFLFQNIYIL